MIDPKDLRIGNWVYKKDAHYPIEGPVQYSNRPHQITAYDIYHMVEDGDPTNHPIPFTPEILEKAGFIWKPKVHRWVHDEPYFMMCEDNLGLQTGYGNGDFIQPYITSLHQLQNTFYYLTGIELKVDI